MKKKHKPSLYKLIFRLKAKHAETCTDWVCSEVLPSIMKTGSDMANERQYNNFGLIDLKEDAINTCIY